MVRWTKNANKKRFHIPDSEEHLFLKKGNNNSIFEAFTKMVLNFQILKYQDTKTVEYYNP